jgi:AbrB family looped-hinge helix DNA binding protein
VPEATLSSKNQIVIPRAAREALRIKASDKLLVSVRGDRVIVLQRPARFSTAIRRMAPRAFPKDSLPTMRRLNG